MGISSNIDICGCESLFQETTTSAFIETHSGWVSYIKDLFYSVPETEAIYFTIDDKDVDFWILIPMRNFNLLCRLVELEMVVLDNFSYGDSSLYRLEFHFVYRDGADAQCIIPPKALPLRR